MFDDDFLTTLEYLLAVSRRVIRSSFSCGGITGDVEIFSSRRKQAFNDGIEFADHRLYVQGDDLRRLDWNLYARLGEQFIKRFKTNDETNVYFLLDNSASMQAGIGDFNKYNYARKIVASLAYIALSDLNQVSVSCFANGLSDIFPLTNGKGKFFNLLKFLERNESANETTNIRLSIENFIRRTKRSGIVIIVSDFFDRDGFQLAIDQLCYNKFEPIVIQIHADFESDPRLIPELQSTTRTNCNLISVENEIVKESGKIKIQNGNEINVKITDSILNQYKNCFEKFLEGIKKHCVQKGVGCVIAQTLIPFDKLILQMIYSGNIIKSKFS
jgi:hypothetical protein